MTEIDWKTAPLVGFDLETTGQDPTTVRIVTASITEEGQETKNWLLNPEIEIPEGASNVHGITTEIARAKGAGYERGVAGIANTLREAWAAGKILVAFNASYDFTIMYHECQRLFGREFPLEGIILDPYVIDRAVDMYRAGKRQLSYVSKHYGVDLSNAHEAEADAIAAVQIAEKLRRHEGLQSLTSKTIMSWQKRQHATKQASFAKYLIKEGRDASDVNSEWPIRGVA